MSYGFLAVNQNNQVLVSTDTRNLHFIQKLTGPRNYNVSATDTDAGIISSTDYFGGVRHWRYTATCSVTPVPFFSTPTADYYGIARVTNVSGNRWDIEVIRSGTSTTVPELYIFADPRASTATDTYGMKVFLNDGTAAFDSRLGPLAITGGTTVSHPLNPRDSISSAGLSTNYCETGNDVRSSIFIPENSNTFSTPTSTMAKPIVFYASLAQAQREVTVSRNEERCTGIDAYGNCAGAVEREFWQSWYWAFYRGGISISQYSGTTYVTAGWIPVTTGCHWSYASNEGFFGIGQGSGSSSDGVWPYTNETLNLADRAVILADGSRYD
jgi:hypothetical protein